MQSMTCHLDYNPPSGDVPILSSLSSLIVIGAEKYLLE